MVLGSLGPDPAIGIVAAFELGCYAKVEGLRSFREAVLSHRSRGAKGLPADAADVECRPRGGLAPSELPKADANPLALA